MSARSRTLAEFSAIPRLEALFRQAHPKVELGIGDDAAVLAPSGRTVWTVDSAVEHVHFERAWLTLADIGYRSFQAAASDVCAMGGTPTAALSSVIFPAKFSQTDLAELARGQRAAARELGCAVIGGNLACGAELSITTTVLGSVARRPLLRSGARVGDELWLCGELGLAAAGLKLLQAGVRRGADAAERRALRAFRRPKAQLAAGQALARVAHAAIDTSDGLAGDAGHIAHASDVEVQIDLDALSAALGPALHVLAPGLGVSAVDLALYGGEDYALLAIGPKRARPDGARVIGSVRKGRGVWLLKSGQRRRAGRGFEHGSNGKSELDDARSSPAI
ncbi:MAG TPA: thiamine-phosphate kinase [Polyangiaceae bacterium]|nr:thiamine-phosphate kinase [Polyangiaceae bacterium]